MRKSQEKAGSNQATKLTPPAIIDETVLVQRAQQGDRWATEQLVLRYQEKMYAIAYRMLSGNGEEAKDLIQEAFIKVIKNIGKYKGQASFRTWLYRIVINSCIDRLRWRRRWQRIIAPWYSKETRDEKTDLSVENLPDTDNRFDPLAMVQRKQLERDVNRALKSLTEKQRVVFQLKVFHEMKISEIAEILGSAPGTVKTHLFRAMRTVRKQLGEWNPNQTT